MKRIFGLLAGLTISISAYANGFILTSTSFAPGKTIPSVYTCANKDLSPQLSWKNPPAGTKSFALIMSDPDAPNGIWYHWVVYNISKHTSSFSMGAQSLPSNAMVGQNSFGKIRYNGPCPPKGAAHHYAFTLYALDTELKLSPGAGSSEVLVAITGHVLEQTQLMGKYQR